MHHKNPFRGRWLILKSEMWDSEALNMLVPAHISFGDDMLGEMELVAIGASVDYRVVDRDGQRQVEFSWSGYDDAEPACGRGWARISGDVLSGQLFIHQGDDTTFEARRDGNARQPDGVRRRQAV